MSRSLGNRQCLKCPQLIVRAGEALNQCEKITGSLEKGPLTNFSYTPPLRRLIDCGEKVNINVNLPEFSEQEMRKKSSNPVDIYFSADIETDGPIPGEYSMLSFAMVYAGSFDGHSFQRPQNYKRHFYREIAPISENYEEEALRVNGLDRNQLLREGQQPEIAMSEASQWVQRMAEGGRPVLVAYPLSFDWSWLYWYFVKYSKEGSPFKYSSSFDVKTAFAVKAGIPIASAGRSNLPPRLVPAYKHTHHALDDATEQAEIFANIFEWSGDVPSIESKT